MVAVAERPFASITGDASIKTPPILRTVPTLARAKSVPVNVIDAPETVIPVKAGREAPI